MWGYQVKWFLMRNKLVVASRMRGREVFPVCCQFLFNDNIQFLVCLISRHIRMKKMSPNNALGGETSFGPTAFKIGKLSNT